jgi:hypothetical protein
MEWLAGNRLRGTTAERPEYGLPSGSVGGWVELARTTLGSAGDTISVASLPDKRYYMLLTDNRPSGNLNVGHRAGNGSIDTGSNYAKRPSINGASDITTHVNNNNFLETDGLNHTDNMFSVNYLANKSDKEKLGIGHCVRQNTAGAGNAPNRTEYVGKWANTSVVIDTLQTINFGSGDLASGSELVVLGWDPSDSHTTNFWEELDSTTTTTSGTIQSGTFTAKKYLMYQIVGKKASGSGTGSPRFQFNGDTGSNYAQRNSINGTDYAYANQASANIGGDGNTAGEMAMFTGFIINNAGTEKLFLGHSAFGNTAGAGQIGNRGEIACKWANTSDQITSIHCMNLNFDAGAIMKIWGAD